MLAGQFAVSAAVLTARFPLDGATGVSLDTPLRLTFDREMRAGTSGRIRIVRVADGVVVDTLEPGAVSTRLVGKNPTPYRFLPVIAAGPEVAIFPRAGVLAYGQSYQVVVEPGAVVDAAGGSFDGLAEPGAWTFATRVAGPPAGAVALTVAADGSGDFATVQGAIDHVPAGNAARVTITVKPGLYQEMIYLGASQRFVTLRGEDRARTAIAYPNNNNFNPGNNRAMVACDASDVILENLTLRNTTPKGGSQAEAIRGNGQRVVFSRVHLASFQDTLLWNGGLFVADSLIEGDVDFLWGGGAAYFQRCELRSLNPGYVAQVRNGETGRGFVFVDCRLTAASGVGNVYLARIDPRDGVANTWPHSEVVFLDCAMGPHLVSAGWRLDNAASAPQVRFREYRSTDLAGATLDVAGRLPDARQLDDASAARYRDPQFVVGFAPVLAPVIEAGPVATTARAGASVRLTVMAAGAPSPAYQWFRDGTPLAGATGATLLLAPVRPGDAGAYTVRATNAGGSVTSAPAALTVGRGPRAGVYAGTVGASGWFALSVRDDGSAVFLARNPGFGGHLAIRTATVDEKGRLHGAAGLVVVDAVIDDAGRIAGEVGPDPRSMIAAPSQVLSGAPVTAIGPAAAWAGGWQWREARTARVADAIVEPAGRVWIVLRDDGVDPGTGTIEATGRLQATTLGGRTLAGTLAGGSAPAVVELAPPAGSADRPRQLVTAREAEAAFERLAGLATRARVAAGDGAAIVGFVIAGDAPRAVVVRGVGPALAALGVEGALSAPRLELFRGVRRLAENAGWASGGRAPTLAEAFAGVGLFALDPAAADAALAITLAPGAYTAQVSGVDGAEGNALVEIYDLAPQDRAQRLANLSTRARVGRGGDALIGGVVVAGSVPKRLLLRGVGPGLAPFGVAGVLARPWLTVREGPAVVAQASGTDVGAGTGMAAAIELAGVEVGAFPLAAGDAAMLIALPPGSFTVQVAGADDGAGVALLEIYELP